MDALVESEVAKSRSEAAAFLIAEGIKARSGLFGTIAEKVDEIREKKEELRRLIEDGENGSNADSSSAESGNGAQSVENEPTGSDV